MMDEREFLKRKVFLKRQAIELLKQEIQNLELELNRFESEGQEIAKPEGLDLQI